MAANTKSTFLAIWTLTRTTGKGVHDALQVDLEVRDICFAHCRVLGYDNGVNISLGCAELVRRGIRIPIKTKLKSFSDHAQTTLLPLKAFERVLLRLFLTPVSPPSVVQLTSFRLAQIGAFG